MAKRVNSRQKGKRIERELVKLLHEHGFISARRGQQFRGGEDSPDVICEELPVHWEAKSAERLNIYDAVEQARCDAGLADYPVVALKKNRRPWVVIMDMDDFMMIMKQLIDLSNQNKTLNKLSDAF